MLARCQECGRRVRVCAAHDGHAYPVEAIPSRDGTLVIEHPTRPLPRVLHVPVDERAHFAGELYRAHECGGIMRGRDGDRPAAVAARFSLDSLVARAPIRSGDPPAPSRSSEPGIALPPAGDRPNGHRVGGQSDELIAHSRPPIVLDAHRPIPASGAHPMGGVA